MKAAIGTKRTNKILLAACATVLAGSAVASAATWTGGGGNDNWTTGANWGGTAPAVGEALIFDGAVRLTPVNDFAADTAFGGITFNPTADAFNITGNRITLGGNIDNSSVAPQVLGIGLLLNGNRKVNVGENGTQVINGVISGTGFGINKTGVGFLTLSGANTYTGNTVIEQGTLKYTADNAVAGLRFGIDPFLPPPPPPPDPALPPVATLTTGSLDLNEASLTATSLVSQTHNTTANTIAIGAGRSLTVNGEFTLGLAPVYAQPTGGIQSHLTASGEGSLVVNAGNALFRVGIGRANASTGGDPFTRLDLSGLANFSFTGTNHFRVGNGNARGELFLANSNTITAAQVRIGDSGLDAGGTGGTDNNNGGDGILQLGAGTNVINADVIQIGRTKSRGIVRFGPGDTTGTLTIAGSAGGASKSNITVGSSDNGNGSGAASQLLFDGHNVTVQGGTVIIGQRAGGAGNSAQGQINFDTGTFNVDNLRFAVNASGTSGSTTVGTLTFGGAAPGSGSTAVLNVANEFFLAQRTNTTATTPGSHGTFIMNGGTANVNADIIDASTVNLPGLLNSTTLTLNDGTLNLMNHSIGQPGKAITNVNLNGGTLNGATAIIGQQIRLGPTVTISTSPKWVIDNSQSTGLLDASQLGTLTVGGGLEGGGGISGNIIVPTGARLAPGTLTTADTMHFSNNLTLGGNSTVRFKLSDNAGGGNDLINVAGTLDVSAGVVNLELEAIGAGFQSGNTYTLFNYSGTPGLIGNETNFAITGPLSKSRTTFTIVPTATTPNQVNLAIGGAGSVNLTWVGNVNSEWDVIGDTNWKDPVNNPEKFFTLDHVLFDDSSTNLNDVTLMEQIQPASITVDGTRNYKFVGPGQIVGGTSLTKNGTGTLTVATNNNYSGPTAVNSGTLVLEGNNTGTGSINVTFGSTLQVGAGGTTGSMGTGTVNNDGTLIINRSDASTVSNVIGGTGEVRHSGTGVTTLSAINTYSGPTNINVGTIRVTDETSLGAANGDVNIADGAALDLGGATGAANGINFGVKRFFIRGNGTGAGVLTNSGIAQQNAFQQVILTDHASVGGTGRIDIRGGGSLLDLAGFNLTKNGPSQFSMVNTSVSGDGSIIVNQGILALEAGTSIPEIPGSNHRIIYNNGTTAQFFNTANTANGIFRPMTINGAVNMGNASGVAFTVNSNINLNGDLTVLGLNNATGALELAGVISESGGARSITKNSASVLTLSSANSYSGTTTVNGGTLRVMNNSGSATGTGPVTLNTGTTLTGTGSISGKVTANSGSHVAPGNAAVGALTLNLLDLAGGSFIDIQGQGSEFDLLNVTSPNGLTFLGNATLQFAELSPLTEGSYTLIDYAGTPIGSLAGKLTLAGTFNNMTATLVDDAASTSVKLNLVAIPQGPPQWDIDGDGSWNAPTSWSPQTVPNAADAVAGFLGKITAPRTVSLDANQTVASLNFDNPNKYTIVSGAGGTLTVGGDANAGSITVSNGSHEVAALVNVGGTTSIDVAGGQGLNLSGGSAIAAGKTVTKTGGGTLRLGGPQAHAAGATLNATGGTVHLDANTGVANSAAGSELAVSISGTDTAVVLHADQDLKALSIAFAEAGAQTLDLASGTGAGEFRSLRVYATDLDATKAALAGAIRNANAAGAPLPTDGIIDSGLHSSSAIGIATKTDHVFIRPTRLGDLNLDGTVTIADFIDLASNFNGTNKTWQEGDLNHDTQVTIADFIDLAANFNGSYSGALAGVGEEDRMLLANFASSIGVDASVIGSAVPEPATLSLLAVGAVGLIGRRRRRI